MLLFKMMDFRKTPLMLANANVDCFVGEFFVGAVAYADDIVLLAPTPSAMRKMLSICDEFAQEYSIVFNARKSKCLIAGPRGRRYLSTHTRPFVVGRNCVDFAESFSHLCHVISSRLDDSEDILHRRCSFIGQTNNVLCDVGSVGADAKYKLFRSYCSSIYGCELWHLHCESKKEALYSCPYLC